MSEFGTRADNYLIKWNLSPAMPSDPLIDALLPEDLEWLESHGWIPRNRWHLRDGQWHYQADLKPVEPRHQLDAIPRLRLIPWGQIVLSLLVLFFVAQCHGPETRQTAPLNTTDRVSTWCATYKASLVPHSQADVRSAATICN